MTTKLFFSSDVKPDGALQRFCREHNIGLTAQSLLQFEAVDFTVDRPFDVVFFSSPRSVNYFISQFDIPANAELAAVGSGTAEALRAKGFSTQFIGEHSGDPETVARDFLHWLGDRTVLFPLSEQSRETVASAVPAGRRIIVRCYRTRLTALEVSDHDVYVFTSPSNVDAFVLKNTLPDGATLVAWGKTTQKKFVEKGWRETAVLGISSEEALVDWLTESRRS